MDILNFISWIKGGRVVTTVDPAKTLLPVGLKDNRRDDGYLAGAISVEDLVTQLTPEPAYKVFTALLTQSGGDNIMSLGVGDSLVIGVTYFIENNGGSGWDFTNVGAPNNDLGTYFVATGTTPNSWGIDGYLNYNTGAPTAIVLENTIGNIWFVYNGVGVYQINNSNDLFISNKYFILLGSSNDGVLNGAISSAVIYNNTQGEIQTSNIDGIARDNQLYNTTLEIRVYN